MNRALEMHERGQAYVIPIIIRPVYWEEAPFAKLQVLPTGGKPITKWSDTHEAFLDVARGIHEVVKALRVRPHQPHASNLSSEKWCIWQQFAVAEAFNAKLPDVEGTAGAVKDEFGQQLCGHWRVHETLCA